jgi:hypothetical protein
MNDKHLTVKGIKYKIVDESWEDRAYEVHHNQYVIYRLKGNKWEKIGETTESWNAESYIPGLYVREKCPTCGHWETKRTIL